jgi:hypothetical protein
MKQAVSFSEPPVYSFFGARCGSDDACHSQTIHDAEQKQPLPFASSSQIEDIRPAGVDGQRRRAELQVYWRRSDWTMQHVLYFLTWTTNLQSWLDLIQQDMHRARQSPETAQVEAKQISCWILLLASQRTNILFVGYYHALSINTCWQLIITTHDSCMHESGILLFLCSWPHAMVHALAQT